MNEYEFTQDENQAFTSLVRNMRLTGLGLVLFALTWLLPLGRQVAADGIGSIFTGLQLYSILIFLTIAYLVLRVVPFIQRIVTTKGNDVKELLNGLVALAYLNNAGRILMALGLIILIWRLLI